MSLKKIKYGIFVICFYLFVFQNVIQNIIPILKYYDEFMSFFILPIGLVSYLFHGGKIELYKEEKIIIICVFAFTYLGLLANLTYEYQPLNAVIKDLCVVLKFFFMYFTSRICLNIEFILENKKSINLQVKLLAYLLSILTILNYCFTIWPSNSYRMGIMSNRLFYSHETNLVAVCVFLLGCSFLTKEKVSIGIEDILLCMIVGSTLRVKGIGATLAIIAIVSYIILKKSRFPFYLLVFLGIGGILLAWKQINIYFLETKDAARGALTVTSVLVAKNHFPVGGGFASFGSYYSAVYYSPLYSLYGIDKVYGIEPQRYMFISDTFWPMILGQFGFLGFIAYGVSILSILQIIQHQYNYNSNLYVAKIIAFVYLLISSTSEAAFVNSIAIPFAVILGLGKKEQVKTGG